MAWYQGDIETAILWFEQLDSKSENWWGKEYALVGLYNYSCKYEQKYCTTYEHHKYQLYEEYKKLIPDATYTQIFKYVKNYNRQMFVHLNLEPVD